MEASSSPFPPLEAVRTVYPKHSRNALSHSSMFWSLSMQRTTPPGGCAYADNSMVSPQGSLFLIVMGTENCSEWLNHTLFVGSSVDSTNSGVRLITRNNLGT